MAETEKKKKSTDKKKKGAKKTTSKNKESGKKQKKKKTVEKAATVEKKSRDEKRRMEAVNRENRAGLIDNIWGIVFVAIGIFLFVAIQFDAAGRMGNVLGDFFKGMFGHMAFVIPWYLIIFGFLLFTDRAVHISGGSTFGGFVVFLMLCLMNSSRYIDEKHIYYNLVKFYKGGRELKGGGIFGMSFGMFLTRYLGKAGLFIFAIAVSAICLMLIINTPVSRKIAELKEKKKIRREEKEIAKAVKEQQAQEKRAAKASKGNKSEDKVKLEEQKEERLKAINIDDSSDNMFEPEFYGGETESSRGVGFMGSLDEMSSGIGMDSSEEPSEKRKNIVFEDSSESGSDFSMPEFDREESVGPVAGYGLDGGTSSPGGYGLDGTSDIDKEPLNNEMEKIPQIKKENVKPEETAKEVTKAAEFIKKESEKPAKPYVKPPLSLLNMPEKPEMGNIKKELSDRALTLENTLDSFNVKARVVRVTRGPAVTRYEIQPDVGVKVNSIVRLADDIALNLRAKSIRIEAPIPGKAAVGIEVENEKINMVGIREIIGSREFCDAKSKVSVAVGKDISGNSVVADLKGMPHLLIAGSTGSGKSVCINSMITSLLYKADPKEVKLILIDPKVVELGNYNGVPHLLHPVVTDPAKAAAMLNLSVSEMTSRYRLFAEEQVRDIEGYNKKMKEQGMVERLMPQVVIIIDELADLMMTASSQVEESICRLAQMARAAGMHLIVATQRPSVDVITGVIKANIPSRIAFAVSSQVDSRTILDMGGAEKLVGKGDMLYSPIGANKPVRVQGCFISDSEVEKVIDFVKTESGEAEYSEEIMETIANDNPLAEESEGDELLPDAIECVINEGRASTSMLQRRFRIGYNRAGSIMDEMERMGIVGPQDGNRPRQILKSKEELEAIKKETEKRNE